jgi:hypothetical protein
METPLPKRANLRRLTLDPMDTKSNTESVDPSRAVPKKLIELPMRIKARKLIEDPSEM